MITPNQSTSRTQGLESEMQDVEILIQKLRVSYRRFFAGAIDIPPDSEREAIARALRVLRNVQQKNPVERFKLANLEAQFNSYCEMFQRRLRDIEDGRVRTEHPRAAAPVDRYDVEAGIVFDKRPSPEAVTALYQGLAKRGSRIELETFRSYLDKQMDGIRKKTGCSAVQFRLVEDNGKVRLKAKPMGAPKRPAKE